MDNPDHLCEYCTKSCSVRTDNCNYCDEINSICERCNICINCEEINYFCEICHGSEEISGCDICEESICNDCVDTCHDCDQIACKKCLSKDGYCEYCEAARKKKFRK